MVGRVTWRWGKSPARWSRQRSPGLTTTTLCSQCSRMSPTCYSCRVTRTRVLTSSPRLTHWSSRSGRSAPGLWRRGQDIITRSSTWKTVRDRARSVRLPGAGSSSCCLWCPGPPRGTRGARPGGTGVTGEGQGGDLPPGKPHPRLPARQAFHGQEAVLQPPLLHNLNRGVERQWRWRSGERREAV